MKSLPFFDRICALALAVVALSSFARAGSLTANLNTTTKIASTIPANGDVNPYGVAVVPRSTGALVRGHVLVSNFNNTSNLQGTETTIVDVAPNGTVNVFAQITAAGLT